jgi:hypothetical protein
MRKIISNNQDRRIQFDKGLKELRKSNAANPTRYPDYELNAMMRHESETANRVGNAKRYQGFHPMGLLKLFTWPDLIVTSHAKKY